MKFATYIANNILTYGSVVETGNGLMFTDVGAENGHDLTHWIESNKMDELKELASNLEPVYKEQDIAYQVPILMGEKIVCIGVNYANRNAEYKDDSALPKYPSVFLRYLDSFVGHNQNMVRPPESDKLDYEGEIVIIIGKGGRRIPREEALDHIAGLTLMNEGTLRDWVRHAKFNVTQGKNFERSGVIGPWMMTADEVIDYSNLDIQTRVNGEIRQNDNTSNLMFPFDFIISYLSTFMTLKPGDMISTGTPNGAGARFDPPIYLKPGDIVEVEAAGIGILKNGVEDEF
ncbi:MAG: fumarylacetoacetate hydrolase family protein [Saprospiraceae bacterium]|nr:fumarylacetoacetate hydrolase family protein [Bacteroidia bacterium]NNE15876.1 fumarylacetoacetate hydrolase family protein [Saprospiraceae bacterium]NNL93350.1 fumarylacetoacetate hydrolase family protein [Saprospiraceae bacterium]